jgi:hypothetical protein
MDSDPAGNDDGAGNGESIQAAVGRDLHAVLPPHRPWLRGTGLEAVPALP